MHGISIQLALGGLGKASDKKLAERYMKKFMPNPETDTVNSTPAEDENVIIGTGLPNGGPRNPDDDVIMQELEALSKLDLGDQSGPDMSPQAEEEEENKRRSKF